MAVDNNCQWRMQRHIDQITRYPNSSSSLRWLDCRDLDLYQHLYPFDNYLHKDIYSDSGSCPGDQQAGRPDDLHVYLCRSGSDQYRV